MKVITAIVRQDRLEALADALVAAGARGLTVTDVRGFGRQYGHLAAAHMANVKKVEFLPKARLEILVDDDGAEALVQEIAKQSGTGTIGDGKLWVTPVEVALRIRTGERDDDALLTLRSLSVPQVPPVRRHQPIHLGRAPGTGRVR